MILCAACSSREVVHIDWVAESASASAAVIAVHAGGELAVFAYALDPRPSPLPLDVDIDGGDAEDARIELLLYERTLAELYLPEGRLLSSPGGARVPEANRTYSRLAIGGTWEESPRSAAIDAFAFPDLRPNPCGTLDPEIVRLQTEVEVEDLMFDASGVLYAITDRRGGLFRIEDGASTPITMTPTVSVSAGGFAHGRLWISTSTGTVWSGVVTGDSVDLERDVARAPNAVRWLLENPYGPKPLVMTADGLLIDLSNEEIIGDLEPVDTTDEGSLIFTDAVYFSTAKSTLLGIYDGDGVETIRVPFDLAGGAVAPVPDIGLLVGATSGQVFRLEGRSLVLFDALGAPDANSIAAFEGGFVVGSDKGVMYRWVDGLGFCPFSTGIVEDLEIGFVHDGGVVFASNSGPDRENAGGMTPVTFVRPVR